MFSLSVQTIIAFCLPEIAKSVIVLDVKPWDNETDLDAMEKAVRSIEADGLLWGQCKSKQNKIIFFLLLFHSY